MKSSKEIKEAAAWSAYVEAAKAEEAAKEARKKAAEWLRRLLND